MNRSNFSLMRPKDMEMENEYAKMKMESPIGTARSMFETAAQLISSIQRINSVAERIRGTLFGFGPACDDGCVQQPACLDDVLHQALQWAEEAEKTLNGINVRILNDD